LRRIQEQGFLIPPYPQIGIYVERRTYCVYVLTNEKNGTLYTGVTSNVAKRINQHRWSSADTFVGKYDLKLLVYAQEFRDVREAIAWEKTVKGWTRARKIALIEAVNPAWDDLMQER
jgi:putative endonuclease